MFESHITFNRTFADRVQDLGAEFHWKFSVIDGDPLLGNKPFAYLTTHDNNLPHLQHRMAVLRLAAGRMEIPILREKIEVIILDTKQSG